MFSSKLIKVNVLSYHVSNVQEFFKKVEKCDMFRTKAFFGEIRQNLMNLVPGKRLAMEHIELVAKWCNETKVKIEVTLGYLRDRVKYYGTGNNPELNHRFDDNEIPNHASLKVLRDAEYEIRAIYDALSTQNIKLHEFTHAIFQIHGYDAQNSYL